MGSEQHVLTICEICKVARESREVEEEASELNLVSLTCEVVRLTRREFLARDFSNGLSPRIRNAAFFGGCRLGHAADFSRELLFCVVECVRNQIITLSGRLVTRSC